MRGEMEMVGTLGSGKEALAPCLSLARFAGHASAMSDRLTGCKRNPDLLVAGLSLPYSASSQDSGTGLKTQG